MWMEDLYTDTTFNPCWFSLDYTFKVFLCISNPVLQNWQLKTGSSSGDIKLLEQKTFKFKSKI